MLESDQREGRMPVITSIDDLPPLVGPRGAIPGRRILEGVQFGLNHLTVISGSTALGEGIALHRHEYEELIIVHAGTGTYTVGETTVDAHAGEIVIIPSGVPHRFANNGSEPLVHTAVHSSGTFVLEYLD
jgi:quercetin dioxygenase-like cupin family protein